MTTLFFFTPVALPFHYPNRSQTPIRPSSVRPSRVLAMSNRVPPVNNLGGDVPDVVHAAVPDVVTQSVESFISSPGDGYELRETPYKGEGVYATRTFRRTDVVVPGVVIDRMDKNHSHATQVGLRQWVQHGGLNSKVNHSCDPNCGIRLNEAGGNDIVARRDIAVGEEISFDYAMRNWKIEHFPPVCLCGAARCRGTNTGFKDLPQDFIEDYEGFLSPFLLELAEAEEKNRAKMD